MRIRFIVLFTFFQFLTFSQNEPNHSYYWRQDKSEAIVAVKNCYIREKANSQSKLLDSIQVGKKITIKRDTDIFLKLKGITTNWAEIEYPNSKNQIVNGYVWKGFLALDYITTNEGTVLTRIDKISKRTRKEDNFDDTIFQITTLLIDDNKEIIGIKSIEKNILESSYFQVKAIGSLGLENLKNIYRISFSGEACGIPTYYFYFAWNGSELSYLFDKMEVGDADVYSHSENFIFPKEKGGQASFIFKEVEESEKIDENSNVYTLTSYKETYKWDGKKVTFTEKSKSKKVRKKLN